jgi:hypothetical protein
MIGPRNSVVAILRGEREQNDYDLFDQSEWINSDILYWWELPELWVDKIHDFVADAAA